MQERLCWALFACTHPPLFCSIVSVPHWGCEILKDFSYPGRTYLGVTHIPELICMIFLLLHSNTVDSLLKGTKATGTLKQSTKKKFEERILHLSSMVAS